MARTFISLIALFVVLGFDYCFAESKIENTKIEQKLSDLKFRAEAQEKMLGESQKEISVLKGQLEKLVTSIESNSEKESNLRSELKKIDTSVQEMSSQVLINRGKISVLRESFRARVKAIYRIQKGSTVFDYFSSSESVMEALKKKRFLTEVAKADRQLLAAVNDAISSLQEGLTQLAMLRDKRQETLANLTLLLANLNKDKTFQLSLVNRKEKQRQSMRNALSQLQSSAQELEDSLSGLLEKHDNKLTGTFFLAKESLIFPVKGDLVHGFGKRKHQEFSDFVFSKGIEVKATENRKVKAAAAGKVVLARELPGYGMVMILDHGSRVYSLYARIDDLEAEVGDQIAAGQKLASVSAGQNLYFELRRMGKAIDPVSYFVN